MEHKELKSPVGKKASVIWEAYQQVLAELKQKESVPNTTVAAAQERTANALAVADTVDVEKIAHELAGLGEGLKEAREVYQNLQRAIDTKRAELTDVHNLEVEVNSLVAVVETKDALVRERTEQAKTILEEASVRAQEIEGEAQKRADELRGKAVAAWEEEKQRRQRDIDVWEYEFSRKKRSAEDEASDEINARMRSLAEREALQDRLEQENVALKANLDSMDEVVEGKIAAAVAVALADAKRSFDAQKGFIERDYKGKIEVLQSKNEGLVYQVEDLIRRLDKAEARIQEANAKVTEIATGALRAGADRETIARVAEVAAGSQSKK